MESLAERIARAGPVKELDAIGWAIRLAKRLEALHQLGVAHGSVSPACILTAGQDRNARAYLADVQHTSAMLTYQSPERLLGGNISMADDAWALAATLYALLTGQSPFAGTTDAEVRQKILAAAPLPLTVFDVGDDDLQHILDRSFAREIRSRTSQVLAFRRALEEWHPDRSVTSLPPLEDEDVTNDDDDIARTVMVHDAPVQMQHRLQFPLQGVPTTDEDDDDNARTLMRGGPQDDLALKIGNAAGQAPAAPTSGALAPPEALAQSGVLAASPPFGPRSAAPPSLPSFAGVPVSAPPPPPVSIAPPAGVALSLGSRHVVSPVPAMHGDDDDDDNARTVRRASDPTHLTEIFAGVSSSTVAAKASEPAPTVLGAPASYAVPPGRIDPPPASRNFSRGTSAPPVALPGRAVAPSPLPGVLGYRDAAPALAVGLPAALAERVEAPDLSSGGHVPTSEPSVRGGVSGGLPAPIVSAPQSSGRRRRLLLATSVVLLLVVGVVVALLRAR